MNRLYYLVILSLMMLVILSEACYYDVEEELYPTTGCDTTEISYNDKILPIIDRHCYGCHSTAANFGNITLEGYDNLKRFVDSGQLIGVIRRESGFSPMPKNAAPLVECDIEKIELWVNHGAKR